MSHIEMSHVTRRIQLCLKTMSHYHQPLHFGLSCENDSCHTQERIVSPIEMSHVTRRIQSCLSQIYVQLSPAAPLWPVM